MGADFVAARLFASESTHTRSQPLRRCSVNKLHPKNKSASAGLLDALHAIHKNILSGQLQIFAPSPYFSTGICEENARQPFDRPSCVLLSL